MQLVTFFSVLELPEKKTVWGVATTPLGLSLTSGSNQCKISLFFYIFSFIIYFFKNPEFISLKKFLCIIFNKKNENKT